MSTAQCRLPPPGWTQVVYRLDIGAVHLLFPDGRDLGLRGPPASALLIVSIWAAWGRVA